MKKIPICKLKDCDEPKLKKVGNTTLYHKFCRDHQIEANLTKIRTDKAKDKQGLATMREKKRKTPQGRFYASAAWINCSHYVLLFYSDTSLMVRCSTSPHLEYHVTDKDIHCGHYHKSDQHKSVCLEFKNLAPQNARDNSKLSGMPEVMAKWIEKTHGKGTLEWLDIEKNKTLKLDKYTLDKISKHYLKLFKAELKRRGIESPWKT